MSASIASDSAAELAGAVDTILAEARQNLLRRQHLPSATYRLQFNQYFTFNQAREIAPYLQRLGISDVYASPYFRARTGSLHGYDIASHNELSPEVGSQQEYDRFVNELNRLGLSQILDTVPNHMGIGELANTWWTDVLENGRASIYAPFFDIDWEPINTKLTNKVLLPLLGDQYGRTLEKKELQIQFTAEAGVFTLHYYDHCFPINPRSYINILENNQAGLIAELGEESEAALEYQSIITALSHLPDLYEMERDRVLERNREKEVIKRRLAALCSQEPRARAFIEQTVTEFNGQSDNPDSFNRLDNLLEQQAYRLSFWRVAAEEINYRRFFDVNELAAVQVHQLPVFRETHRMVLRLVREGKLNGLRIDHVDGLRDPAAHMANLQRASFLEFCRVEMDKLGLQGEERQTLEEQLIAVFEQERQSNPTGPLARSLYIVVEKILGRGETLPGDWPVHGTTGYEFTNAVNGLFVDSANQKAFDEIYHSFINEKTRFADLVYESKKQIMRLSLSSEITVLTNMLNHISGRDRHYRDFTISSIRNAIREVVACFPVYRTYTTRQHKEVDKRDVAHIETAITRAQKRNPAIDPTIFDFLREILLLRFPSYTPEEDRELWYNFVLKFQQTTGPVIAKGLEDTTFYIYNRLISLNEVGGEPEHFGLSLTSFHRQQAERLRNWPGSLLATSTHDTKRSEDVRARINVLSELPREWRAAANRWARANRKHKKNVDGQQAPSRNEEYLLYQTLLGVWPFSRPVPEPEYRQLIERVQAYMRKALNEAKINTSWINPNETYHAVVAEFVAKIMDRRLSARFLDDFEAFQQRIAHYGVFNSLSQLLIKLTSPGVPDIYQGNELWDFSLVDPDNRRPVDYHQRQIWLDEIEKINDPAAAAALASSSADGRIKLLVTQRGLTYRCQHTDLFHKGSYTPLEAAGPRQENLCAYSRTYEQQSVIVAVPRLLARLSKPGETAPATGPLWADTWLLLPGASPGERYRNLFTGEIIEAQPCGDQTGLPLEQVLACFPVALLEKQ